MIFAFLTADLSVSFGAKEPLRSFQRWIQSLQRRGFESHFRHQCHNFGYVARLYFEWFKIQELYFNCIYLKQYSNSIHRRFDVYEVPAYLLRYILQLIIGPIIRVHAVCIHFFSFHLFCYCRFVLKKIICTRRLLVFQCAR